MRKKQANEFGENNMKDLLRVSRSWKAGMLTKV